MNEAGINDYPLSLLRKARALEAQGRRRAEMAEELGVHIGTLGRWLGPRFTHTPLETRRRACELRGRGYSWRRIGIVLGVSASTARRCMLHEPDDSR